MVARAGRPGSAMTGDVNLVHHMELLSEMPSNQARQPWRHCSPYDQGDLMALGCRVVCEQLMDVIERVANRHEVRATFDDRWHERCMCRAMREHHNVALDDRRSIDRT